jgi:hypothetical protein
MTMKTKAFLCLCTYEEAAFKTWTPADHAAIGEACAPHDQKLRATGKVLINSSLSEPETARVVRPGKNGPVVTNGPYAPTPEPVGAVFIVEAADMDEACRIAALHPGVNVAQLSAMKGGIEVRELGHFELEAR